MKILTPSQVAERLNVSERSVYDYLAAERLPGALQHGHGLRRVWEIPESAIVKFRPPRKKRRKTISV